MIIHALCEHYDILAEDEALEISRQGFQKTTYHYTAVITGDGELKDLLSHVVNKKTDEPKSANMPLGMKSTGISSSPVCDNMQYIFGAPDEKDKCGIKFKAAKDLHLELFSQSTSREATAICKFFENWDITKIPDEVSVYFVNKGGKMVAPLGNVAFRLLGESKDIHDCEEIRKIWLEANEKRSGQKAECVAPCAITGKTSSIALLHKQISGVKGAQSTGASLVCFNKSADESYNLKQSHNSRVSEEAMFKYTTVLQWLLNSAKNKLFIGDDTCVFWANAENPVQYEEAALAFFAVTSDDSEKEGQSEVERVVEERVKAILDQGAKGIPTDHFNPDANFYVLGLAPNAGRVSVRYFYRNSFAEFCDKIKRYYDDTKIAGNLKHIKLGNLVYGTVSTKSKDKKVNPLLGGAVMRAVLSGGMYPQLLLNQVVLRTKSERQVTQARAAAIKAYLIRNKKEDVSPMLNEQSTNPAICAWKNFCYIGENPVFCK